MADNVQHDKLTMEQICSEGIDEELNSVVSQNGKVFMLGQYTNELWRLIRFTGLVLATDDPAFEVTMGTRRKEAKATSKLSGFFCIFRTLMELFSDDVNYSPDISLFFDCLRGHVVTQCFFDDPCTPAGSGLIEADLFNDFVATMRAEAKVQGTCKKVADWKRNANKNLASIRKCVSSIFGRTARLLVLRVDLLYRETCLAEDELHAAGERLQAKAQRDVMRHLDGVESSVAAENFARIDVHTAKRDLRRFVRQMRGNKTFSNMVGYIWKMEWSRWGGYHFHCVFFFDGSRVQRDAFVAGLIGDHWETITEGRGFAHNCNRDRRAYRNWGIGRVDYYDLPKRALLDQALSYLAKRDQYVRVKPGCKCRVFQTSGWRSNESPAGRPRSKGPLEA